MTLSTLNKQTQNRLQRWASRQPWLEQWRWEQTAPPTLCLLTNKTLPEQALGDLFELWLELETTLSTPLHCVWLHLSEEELFPTSCTVSSRSSSFPPLERIRNQVAMGVSASETRKEVLASLRQLKHWHHECSDWTLHSPYQLVQWSEVIRKLWDDLLAWTSTLYNRELQGEQADLRFFREFACRQEGLFSKEMASFPQRLAFLHQRALCRQWQKSNLTSWDQRQRDLLHRQMATALDLLIETANLRFRTPEETLHRQKQMYRWSTALFVVLFVGLFGLLFFHRPPSLQPLPRFLRQADTGGIQGFYYKNSGLMAPYTRRTDKRIFFLWKWKKPLKQFPRNLFSVRWKGYVRADVKGLYEFCVRVDDGARLYLQQVKLIDAWKPGHFRSICGKVHLEKGWYPLTLEMFERKKTAAVVLSWKTPGSWKQVTLPSTNLCCNK